MVASDTLIAANTGYLVALVVGGGVAVLTFQRAIETLVSLLPLFATVDPARFDIIGLLAMVAFFVAYGIATHSLDRLVTGAIHALSAD